MLIGGCRVIEASCIVDHNFVTCRGLVDSITVPKHVLCDTHSEGPERIAAKSIYGASEMRELYAVWIKCGRRNNECSTEVSYGETIGSWQVSSCKVLSVKGRAGEEVHYILDVGGGAKPVPCAFELGKCERSSRIDCKIIFYNFDNFLKQGTTRESGTKCERTINKEKNGFTNLSEQLDWSSKAIRCSLPHHTCDSFSTQRSSSHGNIPEFCFGGMPALRPTGWKLNGFRMQSTAGIALKSY